MGKSKYLMQMSFSFFSVFLPKSSPAYILHQEHHPSHPLGPQEQNFPGSVLLSC